MVGDLIYYLKNYAQQCVNCIKTQFTRNVVKHKMKKMRKSLVLITVSFSLIALYSCSRTININLSKSEIKSLDTIYHQKSNGKFFDTEWAFLDKNICQFSTTFVRKKTYTGTWTRENDSLRVSFFYSGKNAPIDRRIAIKDCKKLN